MTGASNPTHPDPLGAPRGAQAAGNGFQVGMRVVVKDGPWPEPRVSGHYGKVIESGHKICAAYVRVQITGHVDGDPPDIPIEWFYDTELEVVDRRRPSATADP